MENNLCQLTLVSIITPVFNGEKWIEQCIKSVLAQTYPRIEHIIVDGGSKDRTLEICRRYPHLVVYSSPDRGQSHAINRGFSMARGVILAWLCADDEYEVNAVADAVAELDKGNQFVMGWSRFTDAAGNILFDHQGNKYAFYDRGMLLRFWRYPTISQPATFWRRELWENCGPLRETLYFAMDYDLWLRMSRKTRFTRVPVYFARYCIHPDAKCFSDNYGSRIELIAVSKRYWPPKWNPGYWKLYFGYIFSTNGITQHYTDAERLLNGALAHLGKNERGKAVASFIKAHIKHLPTPLVPDYPIFLKRVLLEGVCPAWLGRIMRKVFP